MKQYKLTGWPELSPRFQTTAMRRVVSEMSQRFVSPRDLARSSGASTREVEELIARLSKADMLMVRDAPHRLRTQTPWRQWTPVLAVRVLVRTLRRQAVR
jgi:hypothetical protein